MSQDIKERLPELKRLAEAATPGPWLSNGRYIGTKNHMSYIGECRDKSGNWSDALPASANGAYIAAANPATMLDMIDHIEALERQLSELRQAQAVTLTDEEIAGLWDGQRKYHGGEPCRLSHLEFARCIERRLLSGSAKTEGGGA